MPSSRIINPPHNSRTMQPWLLSAPPAERRSCARCLRSAQRAGLNRLMVISPCPPHRCRRSRLAPAHCKGSAAGIGSQPRRFRPTSPSSSSERHGTGTELCCYSNPYLVYSSQLCVLYGLAMLELAQLRAHDFFRANAVPCATSTNVNIRFC